MLKAQEQLHVIRSGVAAIHTEQALDEKLRSGHALRVKLGVDPTAPDLHLGHAVPLRKLRQFQDLGHQVVLIIGDYTALIGDPSGRSATRPALSLDQIRANAETYTEQAFRILDRDRTELRYNSEWLGKLDMQGILKYTSRFTVARILERDDFSKRYASQQPISLHEFLYPVMQAYDSVVVEADVELGGTDQLFNLLAGRELMEKLGHAPQVCLTMPLLEGTDGVRKMSKSYGNYVGLTDAPDDAFGKIMSIPDALTIKYFRLASPLPVQEVDRLEAGLAAGTEHPNAVKRRLAREIVSLYHGAGAARAAEEAFDRVFKRHEAPEDIADVAVALDGEVYVPGLLKELGLVETASEGRRQIDQAAVRVAGDTLARGAYTLAAAVLDGAVVQVGKRRFVRVIRRG